MISAKFQALNPDFKANYLKTKQKHTQSMILIVRNKSGFSYICDKLYRYCSRQKNRAWMQ